MGRYTNTCTWQLNMYFILSGMLKEQALARRVEGMVC